MTPGAKGRGILDTHIVPLPRLIDPELLLQDPSITAVTMAERSVGPLAAQEPSTGEPSV